MKDRGRYCIPLLTASLILGIFVVFGHLESAPLQDDLLPNRFIKEGPFLNGRRKKLVRSEFFLVEIYVLYIKERRSTSPGR